MTEEPQTQTDEENGQEPPTPPDAPPGTDEEEAEDDEARQAEEEAVARIKAVSAADIPRKLERALGDQRKRLEKILGTELEGHECPTCEGMGYMPPGTEAQLPFLEAEDAERCEKCDGWGETRTKARMQAQPSKPCGRCGGRGWHEKVPEITNVSQLPTPTPSAVQPVMGFLNPDGTFAPFGVNTPQSVEQGS